jgi:hypothetical protein
MAMAAARVRAVAAMAAVAEAPVAATVVAGTRDPEE